MTSQTEEPDVFHLTAGAPVADGVRAVADDQLGRALTAIDDATVDGDGEADPDDLHEAVHEARKRCKKVRALLRLVRDGVPDTYDAVNAELRDTARLVSDERDAAAHVETHDLLVERLGEEALAPHSGLRERLVAHRDGPVLERVREQLPAVRERLAAARRQAADWELPDGDAVDVLRDGYERTYRRARKRWEGATDEATSHHWHEWRKRVKYNRYHVNLLQEAWPAVMEQRENLLHDLTDHLGDDNDLWELRDAVMATGDLDDRERTTYVGLVDALRTRIQHRTLPLAARCYGPPVDQEVDRVLGWWRVAIDQARQAVLDEDELEPVIPHGH